MQAIGGRSLRSQRFGAERGLRRRQLEESGSAGRASHQEYYPSNTTKIRSGIDGNNRRDGDHKSGAIAESGDSGARIVHAVNGRLPKGHESSVACRNFSDAESALKKLGLDHSTQLTFLRN